MRIQERLAWPEEEMALSEAEEMLQEEGAAWQKEPQKRAQNVARHFATRRLEPVDSGADLLHLLKFSFPIYSKPGSQTHCKVLVEPTWRVDWPWLQGKHVVECQCF